MTYETELATAAAVVNSFRMIREDAQRRERDAEKVAREAEKNENEAFRKFIELANKATLEPVEIRG